MVTLLATMALNKEPAAAKWAQLCACAPGFFGAAVRAPVQHSQQHASNCLAQATSVCQDAANALSSLVHNASKPISADLGPHLAFSTADCASWGSSFAGSLFQRMQGLTCAVHPIATCRLIAQLLANTTTSAHPLQLTSCSCTAARPVPLV